MLVDPGREPREVFRRALAPGPQPPLELVATTTVEGAEGGSRTVRASIEARVGAALPDGGWPLELDLTAGGAAVATAAGRASPSGALTLEIIELSEGGGALVVAATALADPVPDTPLGVGARWTATRSLDEGPQRVTQRTWYEVLERSSELVLRLQREQVATGEPPLVSDGSLTLAAGRALPTGKLTVSYEDTVTIAGERRTIRVESVLELRAP